MLSSANFSPVFYVLHLFIYVERAHMYPGMHVEIRGKYEEVSLSFYHVCLMD